METNSILITNSGIDQVSGGGIVGFNLVEALRSRTNLKLILSNQKFPDDKYEDIPALTVNPFDYGYKSLSPFFIDYLMYHMLPDAPLELAQMYAGPFGITAEKLKKDYFCKVIVDIAAHNVEISKEEHERLGGTFNYPHLLNPWLWDIYMKHLRLADLVIVHSKKSAEYTKQRAKLSETPMVIPHGCNPPPNIEPLPTRFTVGHLSQAGADKGQIYLFLAWEKLKPSNMDLVVAGPGTEQFNTLIQKMKLPNAKALGRIDNVKEFYNNCSIGVFPTITEGFGICPLEMMAHGRPVIVAEGAGVSELITDGTDGFVTKIRDVDAVKDKILYFYDNIGEVKRMGENARKTAFKYTWEIVRHRYEGTYEKMLG